MKRRLNMNIIDKYFSRKGAQVALGELEEKEPKLIACLVNKVKRRGYPTPANEREDIFWDEFSQKYGIPRSKGQSVGQGSYCS